MFAAGIDIGASAAKAVVLSPEGQPVGSAVVASGLDFEAASEAVFDTALEDAKLKRDQVGAVVACGYGRKNVPIADATKTEIACHARGAYYHFPQAISVIDIGGQDNKVIKIGRDGTLLDFKMNRKCAAGTGAFLEEIARRVNLPIAEMNGLAEQSTEPVELGSFCTVFSATEILALVRKGVKVPDIVKGAFRSVIKRVTEMDPLVDQVVATGGVVAHNPIVVELLSASLGKPVALPPQPQLTGALGAALFALKQ